MKLIDIEDLTEELAKLKGEFSAIAQASPRGRGGRLGPVLN